MKINRWASAGLVALGLVQPLGFLANIPALKAIGLASQASPLPIVFSDVKGLETFASEFSLKIETRSRKTLEMKITPELYSKLGGPYNRRNVYGAAISYGPRLPEKLWQSILRYGFCSNGPLARKFGIQEEIQNATVKLKTKTAGRNEEWELPVRCSP